MKIPLYQIDAFSSRVFAGNPAAVCPLPSWLPDTTLQSIAAENNLAETAYIVGGHGQYEIRWFTPAIEIDLCGHATLASGFVVMSVLEPGCNEVLFSSKSGPLRVTREGETYTLDFPSRDPVRREAPPGLADALGSRPVEVWSSRDVMAVFDSEESVRALRPDMARLAQLDAFAVIATAPGRECDFVSRFFAPKAGIPEDPVTGSAHSTLTPFWAKRLGKSRLRARQVSARGGELTCEQRGDRVLIGGHVAKYLEGTIEV